MPSVDATPFSTTPLQLLKLMELLGDLTSDMELLHEIPRVLVSLLPLDRVTFAIVRQSSTEPDCLLVSAGFEANADPSVTSVPVSAIDDASATFPGAVNFTEPLPPAPGIETRGGQETIDSLEISPSADPFPRPVEVVRQLDARHKLVLLMHWGKRLPAMPVEFADLLATLGDALAGSIRTLLAWRQKPQVLGGPFRKITNAPWEVLCRLGADLSEKELAASLEISPHTLHSYIKHIYLILGVRGRLGAVRLLRQAIRRYRLEAREGSMENPESGVAEPSAAVLPLRSPGGDAARDFTASSRIWVARNGLNRVCSTRA